ncbi:hypothetical protein HDZ31DRAFT_76641 [Schizophyllum fasciatum]
MNLKNSADFTGFRTLRNGKAFSQFYVVPDASFDLDALGLAAAEREMDEAPPQATEDDIDQDKCAWEDVEDGPLTPLSSGHSSPSTSHTQLPTTSAPRSASSSPLSSAPSSPNQSRAPTPTRSSAGNQHAVKGAGRKRRRKEHSRRSRAKKRRAGADIPTLHDRERHIARHIAGAEPQPVAIDLEDAPVTSTGFRALYEEEITRTYTREELVNDHGFVYFPWNGCETAPIVAPLPAEGAPAPAEPQNVVDGKDGLVVGCLAGRPSDGEGSGHAPQADWLTSANELADAIDNMRSQATFSRSARIHRRGRFGAQAWGISHGGGQIRPANLKHSIAMTLVLMYLISLPALVRIAHFGSSAFATWAPAVHHYYGETLAALLSSDAALSRNFRASVWACITINFGPRTVTYPHRDYANLPFGWCAITALGNYDPDKGGDLILWDCKMVIRFPPGSTILIPSAILRHSNTRIGRRERRYSVTQYTAGAIFRWVEHGFQLDEAYYAGLTPEEQAQDRRTAAGRWRRGRAMFSKLSDLVASAESKLHT